MTSNTQLTNSVAIIGHGWLGQALKKTLTLSHPELTVEAFSRTPRHGVIALELSPKLKEVPKTLATAKSIFITLPPGRDTNHYIDLLASLIEKLNPNQRVILISTTSVFEENRGPCDELTEPQVLSPRAKHLIKAEQMIKSKFPLGIVIRSGGQYGGDRYPARYLAKKDVIQNSLAPVNVIHQHDLCRICDLALTTKEINTIHAVAPTHLSKEDFYRQQAKELGLTLPPGDGKGQEGKIINSSYLKDCGFIFEKENSFI